MHKKEKTATPFHLLLRLFDTKDQWKVLTLMVLMLLGAGLEMVAVSLMFPLIDTIARPEASPATGFGQLLARLLPNTNHSESVLAMLILIVAFYVIKNLFFAVLIFLQWRFGFAMQGKLSTTLFNCYLRLPYTFHLQNNTADLLRNLTHEADFMVWGFLFPALTFFTEALIATGLTFLLFSTQPFAAMVITGIFSSVGFLYYWIFRNRMAHWMRLRMNHDGRRIRAIQEGLGALKELKVLGRTKHFLEEYRRYNTERGRVVAKHEVVHGSNLLLLEVLGMSSLLVLAGVAVLQHQSLVEVLPLMGIFAAAAFRLIPATNRIIMNFQQVRSGVPVIEMLAQALIEADKAMLQLGMDAESIPNADELQFRKQITLENISFAYPGRDELVLQNINMTINRGDVIGIVGPSGSGKTTLIDILLGIFPPRTGRILVDGLDIHQNLPAWQRKIGYIPQNNYLVDGTIRDNVALGIQTDRIDDKAVYKALKDAQLESLVRTLPQGIYMPIGELGRQLSGGQRQRVGIARALYHEPEVLVLDEATASLDKSTESRILDLVSSLSNTKTLILISHNKDTLIHCSKIFHI